MGEPVYHWMPQRSPEWHAIHDSMPSASVFAAIMAQGKGRARLMAKYYAVRTGQKTSPGVRTAAMRRGIKLEADAIAKYEFMWDQEVQPVGIVTNGIAAASPDGLLGDLGLIEVKVRKPSRMGQSPDRWQLQGQLWVTGREYVRLVQYCPENGRLLCNRYGRDPERISKLGIAVAHFANELDRRVADLDPPGEPENYTLPNDTPML